MPLIIDTTNCGDLPPHELEFCNDPHGLAFLGMVCGFGSIPADHDTRHHQRGGSHPYPKSFSVSTLMERIGMARAAWGWTWVPSFVTEDFLRRARGWEANISFVTTPRFHAGLINGLKQQARDFGGGLEVDE